VALALESLEDRLAPSAATQLVVTTQPPASVTAGTPFGLVVSAEDGTPSVDTTFTGNVTVTDFYQTLGGTVTVQAVAGVATFSGLTLTQADSFAYLYATSTGLSSAYTNDFSVVAAAATQLVDAGPAGDVIANQTFSHTFNAEDQYNNIDPNFNSNVNVALHDNPTSANLGGTLTVTASSGTVTFSDLTIDKTGTGYTLQATSTGLTPITTPTFSATDEWVVTTQPPDPVTAGSAFSLTAKAEDGLGNVDTSVISDVTVSDNYGYSLGGTTTKAAVNGVISYTDLTLTQGSSHQLMLTSSGVASGTTNYFSLQGAPATQLVFSPYAEPPNPADPTTAPFNLTVYAEDQYGNVDPNFNSDITLALDNNPTGANLGGTLTETASSGQAYFSGLTVDRAGAGYTIKATSTGLPAVTTTSFDVLDGLVAITAPPSTEVAGVPFDMVIAVGCAAGLPDSSFSGAIAIKIDNLSGGSVDTFQGPLSEPAIQGQATFPSLSLREPGSYALIVTAPGLSYLAEMFTVVAAPATQLVITTQPLTTATVGTTFGLSVSAEDPYFNVDTNYSGSVTLALANNPGGATLGGTILNVAVSSGVAAFSDLTLDHSGTGYTLQATSTGLASATTNAITITPAGLATQLVVTTQPPNSSVAGTRLGLVVKAEDGHGTVDTTYTGLVTVAVSNGPTLQGTATVRAVHGVATFSKLMLTQAGSYQLTATAPNLAPATSSTFAVTAGKATKLVLTSPMGYVLTNGYFGVTATAEDNYGNADATFNGKVTLSLGTHPKGTTLGGIGLTASAFSGVASFSFALLNKAGTGYTLKAAGTKLKTGTSPHFNVTNDQLVVTTQPHDPTMVGSAFGFTVSAENSSTQVDINFSGNVTVSLVNYGSSNPTFGGTLTVAAVQGVATFSGLTLDQLGQYALSATTSGMPGTTTNAFSVTAAAASQLVVTIQPPANITSSTGFEVEITAEDPHGNVDTTFNGTVTVAIAHNAAGGTLGGTVMATASQGVATFGGLTLDNAGIGYTLQATSTGLTPGTTDPFDVAPVGVASQLVVATPPPITVTVGTGFGLVVKAEDGSGNVDTSFSADVTIALPAGLSGATLGGTVTVAADHGVATFTGLTLAPPGLYQLTASSTGLPSITTTTFAVTPAPATQLVGFPSTGVVLSGTPFSLIVNAEDGQGNVDPSFHGSITLTLQDNPGGATLGGTLVATAVDGTATFTGLTLDKTGSGFTLQASTTGLPTWISTPFDVVSGMVVVTTQPPSTTTVGTHFGLIAKVENASGLVLTSFQGSVGLVLNNFLGDLTGATLGGTVMATVSHGVATFTNLTVNQLGLYSLSLSGTGLAGTETNTFTVTGAKATQLAVTVPPPSTVTVGTGFEVDVTAEDAHGNLDPNFTGSVTIALANNPGGASLGGTRTAHASGGVATFTGLTLNQLANSYTLRVSSTGLTAATTAAVNVTAAGVAAKLVVTTPPPGSVTAGDAFGFAVTAEDSSGNVDTSFSGNVTVAVNDGTLNGTVTVAASQGVATFSGLSLDTASVYQLSATSGALVAATAALTVNAKAATKLIASAPSSVVANQPFTLTVVAIDTYGNPDFTFNGSITVALKDNPGGATLGGTTTIQAVNGLAFFTDLTLDQLDTGYTLQATSTGLTAGVSDPLDVVQN